jgi:hypothetical protein
MSEIIDSQSGTKLSFTKNHKLPTVGRKSTSFTGTLKLSRKMGTSSPCQVGLWELVHRLLLESPEEQSFPEQGEELGLVSPGL